MSFVVDRFLLGQVFPEDFGFSRSVPVHHNTMLVFTYMLLLQKDKGARPGSLPKDNALSETGEGDIG
jgi:hypothetical protein